MSEARTARSTSQIVTVPGFEPVQFAWCLEVIARDDLQHCPRWQAAFANERKDHRYYELVEDTLHPEFDYRYFVIKDAVGQVCAVQPFFLLDQDLLVGASQRFGGLIDAVRWMWPRLMRTRTLMVGCVAGEGHLDGDEACHHARADLASTIGLNYDPKLHLRHLLDPIDLYVRHTSAPTNALLKHILPAIEPTRYDKTLPKFRNYQELWMPPRDGSPRSIAQGN